MKQKEIADLLFRNFNGDLLTKGSYYSEKGTFESVLAIETACDQQFDFLFEEFPFKITPEIKDALEKRKATNPIIIFEQCLRRKEFDAAISHFEKATQSDIEGFFSKYNRRWLFLPLIFHNMDAYLKRFIKKIEKTAPEQLPKIISILFLLLEEHVNIGCAKYLYGVLSDQSIELGLKLQSYLKSLNRKASDKVFRALAYDDVKNITEIFKENEKRSVLGYYVSDFASSSFLNLACVYGAQRIVKYLIEKCNYAGNISHFNYNNITPVKTAIQNLRLDILQFLLAHLDESEREYFLVIFSDIFSYSELKETDTSIKN